MNGVVGMLRIGNFDGASKVTGIIIIHTDLRGRIVGWPL